MYLLPIIFIVLASMITLHNIDNASLSTWEKNLMCASMPPVVLETILGGAFNPRYMSIDKPIEGAPSSGGKRGVAIDEDFYVDDYFIEQVDEEPAWNINNHVTLAKKRYGLHRSKRGADYLQQWHCKSKIEWTDLGQDYFPRFLRTVVCESEKCWFGLYRCVPRSFTVKMLRRKGGFCAKGPQNEYKAGVQGLPEELKELWVWEERAVNFCCDCERV